MSGACGIDEVGRGCLAGPVLACAVAFHSEPPTGIRDSKMLSATARERLDLLIRDAAIVSIGTATVAEIDGINILRATMLAMRRAHDGLDPASRARQVLVDGDKAPDLDAEDVTTIVRGDSTRVEIAAASIVAKVARDRLMTELSLIHPQYGWERNKGYGSRMHLEGIRLHGATPHHRMSFAPLRQTALPFPA